MEDKTKKIGFFPLFFFVFQVNISLFLLSDFAKCLFDSVDANWFMDDDERHALKSAENFFLYFCVFMSQLSPLLMFVLHVDILTACAQEKK